MFKKLVAYLTLIPFLFSAVAPAATQIDLATQVKGNLAPSHLNSGTNANGSTFWTGNGTWTAPTKSSVGLGNVDNTSDANKPISSATSTALAGKVDSVDRFLPASWRNIASETCFPTSKTGAQALSVSIHKNFDDSLSQVKLVYVNAMRYDESGSANPYSVQAKVEYPIGSTPQAVTWTGSNTGTVPGTGLKTLESDAASLSPPIPRGADFKVWTFESGTGGIPACTGGDFASFYEQGNELMFLNDNAANTHLNLYNLNATQLSLLSMSPGTLVSTGATWASTSGGTLTVQLPNHKRTDTTNVRAILSGFTPSAINGYYVATVSGTNAITVPLVSDPGATTEAGVVQFVSIPSSTPTYNAGTGLVTVVRSNGIQGFLSGQMIEVVNAVPTGYNGKFRISRVDANTFTYPVASDPGTNTSVGYYRAVSPSNIYHIRPAAIIGLSTIESPAGVGDSRSSRGEVDGPSDISRRAGVAERSIGAAFPVLNLSAANDRLEYYVTNAATDHAIRTNLASQYATSAILALGTNDYTNYAAGTFSTLQGYYNSFWNLPPWSTFKTRAKNFVATIPSANTSSRDQYSTLEGQATSSTGEQVRSLYNRLLSSDIGIKYKKIFDVSTLYEDKITAGIMKVSNKAARNVTVSATAGDSLITFDASTPLSPTDHGSKISIAGAGGGAATTFGYLYYISPTQAWYFTTGTFIAPNTIGTTVSSVTARLNVRQQVIFANSGNTVHESPEAFQSIDSIALPSPF